MPKFGYKQTVEHKTNIGKSGLGRKTSLSTKEKISEKLKGIVFSNNHKEKLSIAKRRERHPNWRGGISLKGYSIDWTETLRRSIRERDKYICQLCNKQQGDIVHDVHHIDYNKQNNNPENLIILCHGCHSKTNYNRNYWIEYFKNIIRSRGQALMSSLTKMYAR